ncbi:MAG: MBL fold metallo-hydrolase [Nocardioidaceae bacterium]
MRLTVVGCSGSFPGPTSAASCYLVQAPHEGRTFSLVLDLGSGAFGPLQTHVGLFALDAVALSHLHADHCLDLTACYVSRKYDRDPHPPLPVHGPRGTAERVARAYDLPPGQDMARQFTFLDWVPDQPRRIGPFTVTPVRVRHPVETFALRVDAGGRSLVYSGDTGPCAALEALATGADVLLAEASFVESDDNPPDLHLTGLQAAVHAAGARVGRLLLTHVPPWTDPAEVLGDAGRGYAGPVELVKAGAVYDI